MIMRDSIRMIQKDYENYLEGLQTEKKNCKKFLKKVDTIAQKNAEIGLVVDTEEQKILNEEYLRTINKDIVKVKKVIHRLGVCIDIMLEGEIVEKADEIVIEQE